MSRKGFTLIEVLIVVVIIAVLAALILPRFMNQAERAVIAEAQQILGAIRRGQMMWQDMTEQPLTVTSPLTPCGRQENCQDTAEEWAPIGVTPPSQGTGSFDYLCTGEGYCTAMRGGGSSHDGSTIAIEVATGLWDCTGSYVNINTFGHDGLSTRGCTVGGGGAAPTA